MIHVWFLSIGYPRYLLHTATTIILFLVNHFPFPLIKTLATTSTTYYNESLYRITIPRTITHFYLPVLLMMMVLTIGVHIGCHMCGHEYL